MVTIKQQLVSSRKSTTPGTNGRKYITIHETDNTKKGAGAQAHANLQSNGFSASWHWQVDDKVAIQSFLHTVRCWHGGDGKGNGNYNSIGIEICVNPDSDYKKAVQNAIKLVQKIMKDEGIPISRVVQHNNWSGKNCPRNLRSGAKGVTWAQFIARVQNTSAPSTPNVPNKPNVPANGKGDMQTSSIVTYLNSVGADSSFSGRTKLARQQGIANYTGTASQNTQLLKAIRDASNVKIGLGVATVKIDGLNLRKGPGVNYEFIRKLRVDEGYIVWAEKDGWLNLGGDQWASWQNGVYMDWKR